MLVSFIIPSYNSAQTVRRCLDSIYALSLKQEEFEVIFVDDASTDETVSIIDNFKLQVSNLILLRQAKNNRQGAARNRGVSIAKGEYICFVDSDDLVTEGIVTAICLAKELQTDMTAFHRANVNENGQITHEVRRLNFAQKKVFSGIELQIQYPYWCSAPWGYVYKADFLQRVNYPFREGVLYEDSDYVVIHLYYAQRMAYSSELGHLAYYREGSTIHSISYKNAADYLLLGTRMLAFYEKIKSEGVKELRSEGEAFAEGILEGACWNVMKTTHKMLYKLNGIQELKAFYNRVDSYTDRRELYANPYIRMYFWNTWTAICIKHMSLSIFLNTIASWLYKGYARIIR